MFLFSFYTLWQVCLKMQSTRPKTRLRFGRWKMIKSFWRVIAAVIYGAVIK